MPRLTTFEQFDIAIKSAARDADSDATNAEVAEEFYRDNLELLEPFVRQWVVEKLAGLIRKHRVKARRAANPQLVFEEMLGFKHLPATIETADGRRVKRADATIGIFRQLVSQLRDRESAGLHEANEAIALMAAYTAAEPRITWKRVLEREAASRGL